jgi:lipoate-protein ligase A
LSLNLFPKRIESGSENMASDWWLLLEHGKLGFPAFRHYDWSSPEISFGYGQDWEWVRENVGNSSEKIVRRPTGGGIVRHGKDWTYGLNLPKGHASSTIPALDLYERIHQAMARALNEQGLAASLKPCPQSRQRGIPGDCFSEPVARDLMSEDGTEKMAGAAMKRTKSGVLVQGTMDLTSLPPFDHGKFYSSFVEGLSEIVGESPSPIDWPDGFEKERRPFVRQFSSLSWLRERATG